jgi:4-amino-4-deoxy-L-arabinose transferase-like glycosyltransferase
MESTALPIEDAKGLDHLTGRAALDRALEWSNRHALQIAFGVYCLIGLAFAILGNTNRDEGWYLYASRLVYEGKVPYRDFPYFQTPLLPYIYGLPQLLFGPSLLVGRLTSFAFSLVTIGVGMSLARRFAGRTAALLFVALIVVNLHAMWTFTATRTESLVAPLAMLSLFFLIKPRRSTLDLVLASSLMLWATAVRLTMAPAFLAVLALCLYQAKNDRSRWDKLLVSVGFQAALLFVVPFALSPDRMVFDVWTAQQYRGAQFFDVSNPLGAQLRDKALFLPTLMAWYPATVTLTAGIAVFLAVRWRRGWRPSMAVLGQWPAAHLLMLFLVALLFLPHLALNTLYDLYFVPAFAVAALLAATAITHLAGSSPQTVRRLLVPGLVGSLVLVEAFAFADNFPQFVNTADPELTRLQDAGAYLNTVVPPDKRILAFDTSVVFEANRRVNDRLEMELFSYWPRLDTSDAERYGVVNYEMLQQMADDEETAAIVMSTWDELRLMTVSSSDAPRAEDTGPTEFAAITLDDARYYLAKEYPGIGGEEDNLYIYLRVE